MFILVRPNDFEKNRRYFPLTYESGADKQALPHDLMGLRLTRWLCHPLDMTSMIPLVDSMVAEKCMPNVLRPRLGNVIHHLQSNSFD